MHDLSHLLTAHPFPTALGHIHRSFARQPDNQTCGALALRHGLLLGGLVAPAAALEAILDIRTQEGTSPTSLRSCLTLLGFDVQAFDSPRQPTTEFLDSLRPDFERGAFLLPCVFNGGHWVCVGSWHDGCVGLVDSFFGGREPSLWPDLPRGLGFNTLTASEFDDLDWGHHVTLVRPGTWQSQYQAWLPARPTLLRLHSVEVRSTPMTMPRVLASAVHQHLNDADSRFRSLNLHIASGICLRLSSDDPGANAASVEVVWPDETVVIRRLVGLASGHTPPAELVMRGGAVGAARLVSPTRKRGILRLSPPSLRGKGAGGLGSSGRQGRPLRGGEMSGESAILP
jgi:hypothetical protein